jgi:hypothetical protein
MCLDYAISQVKFNYLRHVNCTVYISGHPNNTGGILGLASILKVAPVLEKLDLHVSIIIFPLYRLHVLFGCLVYIFLEPSLTMTKHLSFFICIRY